MENERKGIGTIDALTAGFTLVARRFWILLIPAALNVFLWMGPRLSVAPLAQQLADMLQTSAALSSGQYGDAIKEASQMLAQWGDSTNLFALLAVAMPYLGVVSRGAVVGTLANWPLAIVAAASLLAVGTYLAVTYLTLIARQVRRDGSTVRAFFARATVNWLRLVALGGLLLGVALVLLVPAAMLTGVVGLLSVGGAMVLASLTAWGAVLAGIWLYFYLFFVTDAIVLDGAALRLAVARSLAIVRRNTGASMVLVLATMLLTAGLGVIWDAIGGTVAGVAVGIIANAYVGSALVAASLIFYASRWRALEREVIAARAGTEQP